MNRWFLSAGLLACFTALMPVGLLGLAGLRHLAPATVFAH